VTKMLLAEFAHVHGLRNAARTASQRGYKLLDAFTPFPVEGVADLLDSRPSKVRVFMFAGGILIAAMAYGGEYYTAVVNYPYNSGGRPLNSWPAFMLVPFATGIFGASVAGFIRFLYETGLPRLHFPLFAVAGVERASQDRFFLAIEAPDSEGERHAAVDSLRSAGALTVREVDS
jgi:ActD protein